MFGFLRSKTKSYKGDCFSFDYPGYMRKTKEDGHVVSFAKWRKPPGVFRISRHLLHAQVSTKSEQLINQAIAELAQDEIEYELLEAGDLSGIYYKVNNRSYNFSDTLYWGNGLDRRLKDEPKGSELEQAIWLSSALRMTEHFWELGNDKMHIWFSYRHFYLQSEESDKKLNEEIAKVKEIFPTIRMR